MNIYYINLDAAAERRNNIERNLAACAHGTRYQRIPAFDAEYVNVNQISGSMRPGVKACFLSHIEAIETSLESEEPSLILEDDAILGARTIEILNEILPTINGVDILFTDVCAPNIHSMLQLFKLRNSLADSVRVFDIRQIHFAGSSGYILPNNESKKKVLAILKSFESIDVPYDLVLRDLINDGRLTSSACFPFLTSLTPGAAMSQIQLEEDKLPNVVYDTFRKLMFFESERVHPDLLKEVECVPEEFYDRNSTIFTAILRLLLSRNFPFEAL